MPSLVDNRGQPETIKVKPTFRVVVLIGDRWVTLEDAQDLSQVEAHVRAAQESAIVGKHRINIIPNARK